MRPRIAPARTGNPAEPGPRPCRPPRSALAPSRRFPGGRGPHPSRAAGPGARSASARPSRAGRLRSPPRSPPWPVRWRRISHHFQPPQSTPPATTASNSTGLHRRAPVLIPISPDDPGLGRLDRSPPPSSMWPSRRRSATRSRSLGALTPHAHPSPRCTHLPFECQSRWANADVESDRCLRGGRPDRLVIAGSRRLPTRDLFSLLVLSAWCGLVAGLLEVGITILRKRTLDFNHLYRMSASFRLADPVDQSGDLPRPGHGLVGPGLVWPPPRPLARPAPALRRSPCSHPSGRPSPGFTVPPGFLLALGVAARLVPVLERHATGFRRLVRVSFPVVAGLVPISGGLSLGIGPAQGVARGGAAAPAAGLPQRALDRAGHGGSGPSEPLRLQPSHQPDDR